MLRPAVLIAAALFAGPTLAECPDIELKDYGEGCGVTAPAALGGAFDPAGCTLTLNYDGRPGPTARFLVVGASDIGLDTPQYGIGCELLATPDVILMLPTEVDSASFAFPPVLPGYEIFVQGGATFAGEGGQVEFELTNGIRIRAK